jgi:hypothetical protein
LLDDYEGLSTNQQQSAHTAIINGIRQQVDEWRRILLHPPALQRPMIFER